MTDTDRIAQMAREAHDAGAKAGGWVRQWEHMAPSQRKEWEAVALAVARLVAEDCAQAANDYLTKGRSPLGLPVAQAIRARYSKEPT